MSDPKQTSREEDFRDYEQRDIRDGWPYADRDEDPRARRNAPYGTTAANLDEIENEGMDISRDPDAQEVHGAPLPFAEGTGDAIADDDLENRITERLEEDGRIDMASLEIAVRHGVAHIEGSVDSDADRGHLIALVRAMAGVRDVLSDGLTSRGVDSHMPRDVDE